MQRSIWACLVLISLVLVLTEASKKSGKNKGGGWNNGNNRNTGQGAPGTNWNSGSNWGQPYNPSGGNNFNNKQWKPPKSKTNMKMAAGAAAVGVVGGFMLGSAVGRMSYQFDNNEESRYYDRYHNQMPNQVYRPVYRGNAYIPEDRFVNDCFNMTVTEYIVKPAEKTNSSEIDTMETKVKSQIIRQMCISEYRTSYGFGLRLLCNPWLVLSITLFVYFVVQ
ncbi:hypothetical protein FKM82_012159 [Ascaphus truei]|uniref:major prion protein homolog n=1 Tax=Ascaphus truei TaxID=8439 RepID=UPI003F591FE7